MKLHAWSFLSLLTIKRLAAAVLRDPPNHPDVVKLANIDPRQKDLQKKFGFTATLPKLVQIHPPLVAKKDHVIWMDFPVIMPHQMFDALWRFHKPLFLQLQELGPEQFWRNVQHLIYKIECGSLHKLEWLRS